MPRQERVRHFSDECALWQYSLTEHTMPTWTDFYGSSFFMEERVFTKFLFVAILIPAHVAIPSESFRTF